MVSVLRYFALFITFVVCSLLEGHLMLNRKNTPFLYINRLLYIYWKTHVEAYLKIPIKCWQLILLCFFFKYKNYYWKIVTVQVVEIYKKKYNTKLMCYTCTCIFITGIYIYISHSLFCFLNDFCNGNINYKLFTKYAKKFTIRRKSDLENSVRT